MTAADLRAYMQPVDGPLAFVREQIVLADGRSVGEAMAGDPWVERDLLRPVFAVGEAGLPVYRLAYLELPRGHWKSGGAAAIAVTEALLSASTDVVVAAADREQPQADARGASP
jgi:phage terminase large subunit-like protein